MPLGRIDSPGKHRTVLQTTVILAICKQIRWTLIDVRFRNTRLIIK